MNILRTPDERFRNLVDFPYAPHYLEIPGGMHDRLRIHFVDEGPRQAAPVLLLHGEPTWSYLYRKMIPGLLDAGHRVVVPDLVGFGRSDKPTQKRDYTFPRHVAWMRAWLQALDLRRLTLFGQDWGSVIGLTLATLEPERVDRIALSNGGLPDPARPEYMPDAFARWQAFAAATTELDIGALLTTGGGLTLSPAERAAYDAPFPDASYQAGALVFPALVEAQSPEDNTVELLTEAWKVLDRWTKPFLTAYGKADPILGGFDRIFQARVPGAKGQPHREFADGVHFIQDQKGPELAEILNAFIAAT
ncbi:MAG: haloalkane dehalogenase [Myxococcota bacterium]